MIVACPECGTRYNVDDAAVAAGNRRQLRCAHCGHRWAYAPAVEAAAAIEQPAANPQSALAPAPLTAVAASELHGSDATAKPPAPPPAPDVLPRPSVAAEPPQRRRGLAWAAAFGAAALAATLVLGAILGRDRIETLLPSTAPLYARLHLDAPGAGLKVSVVPIRRADALVISGDIVNDAPGTRQVPRLKLTLLDANRTDLVSKVIDPPVARLPPGARAHFDTIFEHPANSAVRVNVTYATP